MKHATAILFGLGITSIPAAAAATPPLRIPWPCGVEYRVSQGHNTGSHQNLQNAWAWDFSIPVGGEVVAAADGVVRAVRSNSTRGGCGSAYVNDAHYITIRHGDGTEAAFTHLLAGSIPFSVGDTVKQGDVVGKVGLTGWVCGAHLHFNIQKACDGPWVCETIPAEFISVGDPTLNMTIISDNCGLCEAVLDGTVTTIDDMKGCFERRTSYWWQVGEGHEDHHFYTIAADAAAAETTGEWVFEVGVTGTYALEVFIPADNATSTSATYIVRTATGDVGTAAIDQSTQKGWVPLGEFDFSANPGQLVRLELAAVPLALDQLCGPDHSAKIDRPGIPRPGDLPPSHAFTVAPTSANSPSCRAPCAFRPAA